MGSFCRSVVGVCWILCVSGASGFWVKDPVVYQDQRNRAQSQGVVLERFPVVREMGAATPTNVFLNGDFSAGLAGWSVTGGVSGAGGEAQVTDIGTVDGGLSQLVALAPGSYTIEFDFASGLSSTFAIGTFPDTFFASLYFTDTPGSFDIASGSYDTAIALLDMDYLGIFNPQGVVSPSIKGGDWQHFSASFVNGYGYLAVSFEMADLNGSDADSSGFVDNVILLVPEPSTLVLVMAGVGALGLWQRRRTGA
ncbi:MAG: PEP-CTERM sorting domain-containing protein [Verrucomicrobia bacterium]|nr:PEP-CTERM sorting domain-containing protein [Kiritimatiellia bacterium]MCP5487773.1 PEP-CTERM sorting domain-containing protein [Verrucomicrobiota bacterium]